MVSAPGVWATRKLRAADAVWRAHGLRGMRSAARHWLFSRGTYVRLGLDLETRPAATMARGGIEISRGDGEALPVAGRGWHRLPVEFQLRVPGRRFYLVRCDGEVAHVSWVLFPGDRSRFLALGRGDVEITDSHTVTAFRSRGIYTLVLSRILEDMKREGFRTAYAHVLLGNESSRRAMRAAGFRPLAAVSVTRLAGIYRTTVRAADSSPAAGC